MSTTNTDNIKLLTRKETAKMLRCSSATLWRRQKNGLLHIKQGAKVLFRLSDINTYIEKNLKGKA